MTRTLLLTAFLALTVPLTGYGQQAPSTQPQTTISTPPADNLQALKSDAEQMRLLINQMRNNLGFIQNTTTPLHHQFELEIDMWQLLLEQMQRHINALETANKTAR